MRQPAKEKTAKAGIVPRIAVLDRRRHAFGPPVEDLIAALQTQVSRDFAPQWGRDARIFATPTGHDPSGAAWWLVILDYAGSGVLGHHFVTNKGIPQAVVGAIASGERWPATASHELLEMLSNPWLDSCIYNPKLGQNIPREVCDPCEADAYPVNPADCGSIQVANFVYPSWFGLGRKGEPFDQMRRIHRPFEVSPNGGRINPTGCSQAKPRLVPPKYRVG